jgi:hypothetical protein
VGSAARDVRARRAPRPDLSCIRRRVIISGSITVDDGPKRQAGLCASSLPGRPAFLVRVCATLRSRTLHETLVRFLETFCPPAVAESQLSSIPPSHAVRDAPVVLSPQYFGFGRGFL